MTLQEKNDRVYELRRQILIAEFQRDMFGPGGEFAEDDDKPAVYEERLSKLRAEMREIAPHRPEGHK